jgi:DtxR family Mn-dependent transcriptional regulator
MIVRQQLNLIDLPLNKMAEVSGVGSQSSELLELLKHRNISMGTKLEVKRRFGFDHSIELRIKGQQPFTISQQLAQALFVKLV